MQSVCQKQKGGAARRLQRRETLHMVARRGTVS
jgi:hypothetical protein